MYKYLFSSVVVLTLFSGCGGDDTPQEHLGTTSTQDNTSNIEQSLRSAGYHNASNITNVGTNTITFTYLDNGKKHFVVYNSKEGKVLSNIAGFIGDTVTTKTHDTVSFDNGTTVNIANYTKPTVITKPVTTSSNNQSSQNNTPAVSPLQIMKNRFGDALEIFTYTPNKQGAAVVISTPGARALYLYGLENPSNPIREYEIYGSDDDDVFTNIKMLGNGLLQYTYYDKLSSPRRYITVVYNYIDKYKVSDTSTDSSNNQNNNTLTTQQIIENTVRQQSGGLHQLVDYKYTNSRQGMLALSENDRNEHTLYIFGLSNGIPQYEKKYTNLGTIDYAGRLSPLSGGRVKIIYGDGTYTQTYDYIDGYEVSNNSNINI